MLNPGQRLSAGCCRASATHCAQKPTYCMACSRIIPNKQNLAPLNLGPEIFPLEHFLYRESIQQFSGRLPVPLGPTIKQSALVAVSFKLEYSENKNFLKWDGWPLLPPPEQKEPNNKGVDTVFLAVVWRSAAPKPDLDVRQRWHKRTS